MTTIHIGGDCIMITKDQIRYVIDWLGLSNMKYKLFMGSSLCVRGLRETNDIDLGVTSDKFESLCNRFNLEPVKSSLFGREKIDISTPIGNIELYELYNFDHVEEVDGLLCQSIDEVIRMKKHLGRDKDLKDLRLLAQIEA